MFTCPRCQEQTKTLSIPVGGKLGCRTCNSKSPVVYNVNLGQTVDRWEGVDKNGNVHKHKLTTGKAWELDQRRLTPDGKHAYNIKTGRGTQY